MQLIPDWAPNIHPMIVHFPIALLIVAVLFEFLALVFASKDWLRKGALSLYFLGTLAALTAYFSGKEAADVVKLTPPAYGIVGQHADLALYTLLFFGFFLIFRLVLAWQKWDQKILVQMAVVLFGLVGLGLLQQTAEQGARLVFEQGIGVKAAIATESATKEDSCEIPPAETIVVQPDGSWSWKGKAPLDKTFHLLNGSWEDLKIQNMAEGARIEIGSQDSFLMVFGPALANLQMTANVDLTKFTGTFYLIHHVQNIENFDFFRVEGLAGSLGRKVNGKFNIMDSGKFSANGALALKAVASKGHFRAYVNNQLLAHGHGGDLPPGPAGIGFKGSGEILLKNLEIVSLDKQTTHMSEKKEDHSNNHSH